MEKLKAGFSRLDITPPLGVFVDGYYNDRFADGILDPLEANCVAVSDGEKTAVLLSIDICEVYQVDMDKFRHKVAEENGIEVVYVRRTVECPLGGAVLSLYPPVGEGDLNEQGLTALCSAGDFDVLITGDMAGSTERKLVGQYDLPDIEVLMVGHHGSRYSSSQELLQAVRPETAIISVGDNSYGHPTQEAMDRLSQAGAEIYRTDRQGNILVTVHGGD